jgi:hypothetical protein
MRYLYRITEKGASVSKSTALKLALFSALLSVLFGLWQEYVCFGAAFLLMLIFDGIWAHKVDRDHRLSKLHMPAEQPPIVKTSSNSTHLSVPSTD